VQRWLFILLAVGFGWFSPANAQAHTRADGNGYDARQPMEKVVLVAGITMDTHDGDQEDPLSLHKYLYCEANPVNMTDRSGHDPDLGSLMASISTMASMAANFGVAVVAPVLNQVTLITFEALTGQSAIIGGGAAIAGGAALGGGATLSKVEGGMGSWMQALSELPGVVFGPGAYVRQVVKGTANQMNRLNQSGGYRIIPRMLGASVETGGNAFIKGTQHNAFHVVLEQFWNQYREGGPKYLQRVSNQDYLKALGNALAATNSIRSSKSMQWLHSRKRSRWVMDTLMVRTVWHPWYRVR
jgi:hypothetical protein